MRHRHRSTSWVRIALLTLLVASPAGIVTGCADDYLAIVAVSPSSVNVSPGGQVEFSAAVVGIEDKTVNWAVNEVIGGNETFGTISEDGLYTAPAQIPEGAGVKIRAMCAGDASVYGEASVTIVSSITIEMEDFLTSHDEGGVSIRRLGCSGASGGTAVEGFDVIGDYITFQVTLEVPGRYSATLRQAAPLGAHNQVKMTLEGAGTDGSDQEALFDIEGLGIT
jgi:hypothetical protein